MKKPLLFILSFIISLSGCSIAGVVSSETSLESSSTLLSSEVSSETSSSEFISSENSSEVDPNIYNVAGLSFHTKNELNLTYNVEPNFEMMNYLLGSRSQNSTHFHHMVEGLAEYDKYGNIVLNIAESFEAKVIDGKVNYIFKIKENIPWVINESGEIYGEVVAEDFVTSAKYVLDKCPNNYGIYEIYTKYIEHAKEYYEKEISSFNKVGVKALDKYHIQYTLKEPHPDFLALLMYSAYYPVNKDYLEEQGDDFGKDFNHILVNGPFLVTEHQKEDHITYIKNPSYFDKKRIHVDKINRKFIPKRANPVDIRNLYEEGKIDEFIVEKKDVEGYQKYVGDDIKKPINDICNPLIKYSSLSTLSLFNFNRYRYDYPKGSYVKNDNDKRATAAALLNSNFRKGFLYGLNYDSYLNEEYNYYNRLINPKGFINDNKDYTSYVNDIYNKENGTDVSLIGIDNGSDPIFDNSKAAYYFALAKEELEKEGIQGPIYIDIKTSLDETEFEIEESVFKYIEEASSGLVVINYLKYDTTVWTGIIESDIIIAYSWAIDYHDPMSMLEAFDYNGALLAESRLKYIENQNNYINEYLPQKYLDLIEGEDMSESLLTLRSDLFGEYHHALIDANEHYLPHEIDTRYALLAEAEYKLIYEDALCIPFFANNKYEATVSNIIPYQNAPKYNLMGIDNYKDVVVSDKPITQEEYQIIYQDYLLHR